MLLFNNVPVNNFCNDYETDVSNTRTVRNRCLDIVCFCSVSREREFFDNFE